jgi:ABC-type antimicrobial peptide transport system permease subunit
MPGTGPRQADPQWRTVVGVVGNVSYRGLTDQRFDVYETARQNQRIAQDLVIRQRNGQDVESIVRAAILRSNPRAVIYGSTRMDAVVDAAIAPWRFSTFVLGCFAVVALCLASVGLVGLVTLDVTHRRKEFAIRLALGAPSASIVRLSVTKAMRQSAVGLALGLGLASVSTTAFSAMLFEVQPIDPLTFATVAVTMLVIAAIASYVPARLGLRVNLVRAVTTD